MTRAVTPLYAEAPPELRAAIEEFFENAQWENAAAISYLESGWSAFAMADTRGPDNPCGAVLSSAGGVVITAELSIGWFQINACNLPVDWHYEHLYNTRHNVGTAHKLFAERGGSWTPWYFSAKALELL